jgi:transposase
VQPLLCIAPARVRTTPATSPTARRAGDRPATAELRCYQPERPDAVEARLRHLGARRARLITQAGAARQQLRDLLECAHPGLLDAAADPLDSLTWRAAVTVALGQLDHAGGEVAALRRIGRARFAHQVAAELGRWGGQRRRHLILRACGPPPPTRPPSGSPTNAPVAWSAPGWCWPTGTTPSASSRTSASP